MDTLGIIRQIEADAGLRAQLRAVLLGDEILELPRWMAELADGQRRLQDAMEQTQATLTSFMASTDVRLTSLESDVSGLKADVSGLKGSDLERRLREQPARYLDDYVERIRVVGGEALDDLLESLERQEPLDVDERRRLRRTDLIADARRVGSTERLTVVGEVSVTLHDEDVTRAAACSEIFRRRGRRSLAIAAGAELGSEGVARLAQTYDVELVRPQLGCDRRADAGPRKRLRPGCRSSSPGRAGRSSRDDHRSLWAGVTRTSRTIRPAEAAVGR